MRGGVPFKLEIRHRKTTLTAIFSFDEKKCDKGVVQNYFPPRLPPPPRRAAYTSSHAELRNVVHTQTSFVCATVYPLSPVFIPQHGLEFAWCQITKSRIRTCGQL